MPVINQEWEEKIANGEPLKNRLSFISARATQMLAEESAEVQKEVEIYRKKQDSKANEGDDPEVKKVKEQQQ